MPPHKILKLELPTGCACEIKYPETVDEGLVEVAARAFLGTLAGLGNEPNNELRRAFLIKYSSAIINLSEMSLKRLLVARKLEPSTMAHIVDNFLRSLNK